MRVDENIKNACCDTDSDISVEQDVKSRNRRESRQLRFVGAMLFYLYGLFEREIVRRLLRWLVLKLEGGALYSVTIRRIFSAYHSVELGMYSWMDMFMPDNFTEGTRIFKNNKSKQSISS